MQINEDIIISDKPVVRDIGVLLDCELMIERHKSSRKKLLLSYSAT